MYLIIEFQTNEGQMTILPAIPKETREEAESVYHSILSFAAVSSVEIHGAFVLNEEGREVLWQAYHHEPSPEPNEEVSEE